MGCDIHWMIERQDTQGTWHAVMSEAYAAYRHFGQSIYLFSDFLDYARKPIISLGSRDYHMFAIFSRVRTAFDEGPCIAESGTPQDASQHAVDFFDDDDLHSHGHFTLGRLRECVAEAPSGIFEDFPDGLVVAKAYLSNLLEVLSEPAATNTIIVGPVYAHDDTDQNIPFLPMDNISSHEKLRLLRITQDLKPVGDDTIRVLIAYDN